MADEQFIPQTNPTPNISPLQPGEVDAINPNGELVAIPHEQLQLALQSGYRQPSPDEIQGFQRQKEFGTPGQQAITALEGGAQAATFGTSPGIEVALGLSTPERIRAREEVNPGMHALGEVGSLAATSLIPGVGEANILREAGTAGAEALGLGAGGSFINQVGRHAVQGAFENALFQGGEEIAKAFKEDPNQTAESIVADMGLASVMGGVFGGTAGAALQASKKVLSPKFVSELDKPLLDTGDFKATVEQSNLLKPKEKEGILASLGKEKKEAPEIRAAAGRLGAPVLEGMISDSPLVQRAEDSLINSAPTYSGIKRQALYKQGYEAADKAIEEALGPGSNMSKAELGASMRDSIVTELQKQNQPIADMYAALKAQHQVIPLEDSAISNLTKELEKIQEFKISPSSPAGAMAKRVLGEIEGLKTVDDVKAYKSILQQNVAPMASSGEKRMASIIGDKLTELEENTIEGMAKRENRPELMELIAQRKEANRQYSDFIDKVKTLSEQLGKGRVYGVQDAINFIQERLTPEEITSKLFSKKDSGFLKFFEKEFPGEMSLMRDYQKGELRNIASRTGQLSPKVLFNNINKLEPEIQKSIFSAEELQKLKDAETYIRAFPKNFNPSGTAHTDAFREFFKHGVVGGVVSNARDLALEQFIKAVSASPDVNNAVSLAKAAIRAENSLKRNVASIFEAGKPFVKAVDVVTSQKARDKLDKLVMGYQADPSKLFNINANNPIPVIGQGFAATSQRAMDYLSAKRPPDDKQKPLDSERRPASMEKAVYNRALDIAENPISIMDRIKSGTITISDVKALNAIYPSLYNHMVAQLNNQMIETIAKGQIIPYATRMALSTFMLQPLDSTMTPQAIIAAQPLPQVPGTNPQGTGVSPSASKMTGLNKLPIQYQTPNQSRDLRFEKQ